MRMNKQVKKKLSVTELIKDKEKFLPKDNVTQDIYVERLDATVTIRKPERTLVLDTLELADDKNYDGVPDEYFIYNIITEPDLKDPELQKAYGCVEPTDIIAKIFEIGEVTDMAKAGMKLGGYSSSATAVEDLKN